MAYTPEGDAEAPTKIRKKQFRGLIVFLEVDYETLSQ
tara:strand:+ start:5526 stop:5636 length:111 start_codon:yes stop_codon:yes gene_type:complete